MPVLFDPPDPSFVTDISLFALLKPVRSCALTLSRFSYPYNQPTSWFPVTVGFMAFKAIQHRKLTPIIPSYDQ